MKRRISKSSIKAVIAGLMAVMAFSPGGDAYARSSDVPLHTTVTKGGEIHGTVKDSQGEPLIGATVMVKGTRTGTQPHNYKKTRERI